MVSIVLLVVIVGVLGMIGLFAAGFLMNRSKADQDRGDR